MNQRNFESALTQLMHDVAEDIPANFHVQVNISEVNSMQGLAKTRLKSFPAVAVVSTALLVALLAVAFIGLHNGFGASGGNTHTGLPVTLPDSSAKHFMIIAVVNVSPDATAPTKNDISIAIDPWTPNMTNNVRFVSGETFVCNNVVLTTDSIGGVQGVPGNEVVGENTVFNGALPPLPAGATIHCEYLRSHTAPTEFDLTVPDPVRILSPKSGATVMRSKTTTIHYSAASGGTINYDLQDRSQGGVKAGEVSNTGSLQIDTTQLVAGAGGITIDQQIDASPSHTGFSSAIYRSHANASINVTWK
jgi:hypothetical protein